MKTVTLGDIQISNARPFALLAGPCQLESLDHARMLAGEITEVTSDLGVPFIFKASYDKANRTSLSGQRGLGIEKDMAHVLDKVTSTGNDQVMLCERGTSFGYNTLVSDFRGLPEMAKTGHPVVFDATHSVQQPGGQGGATGGQREMVPVLARAAVAVGVGALFMEVHQAPDTAPSDGPNMVRLEDLRGILETLVALDGVTKGG